MPAKLLPHYAAKYPVRARKAALATMVALGTALTTAPLSVQAVGLGDLDVRSYLGEPLNLRIGVISQPGEELDTSCFAVISPASGEPAIVRRDVRVTLVENKGRRYLELRGTGAYNEPIARLSVRAACRSETGVVRDYALLLDPAPLLTPTAGQVVVDTSPRETQPAQNAGTESLRADTRGAEAAASTNGAMGRWTVFVGDTLNSIAKGIYPNNRAKRSQYIATLRQLNPELAGIANDTPLFPNSQLALPDLKALSGVAPGRGTVDVAPSRAEQRRTRAESAGEPKASAPVRPATAPTKAPPRNLPQPAAGKSSKTDAPATAKPVAKAEGFTLRLSGGDIDVSRSQGVTEEVRAQLRERQLLLDSDDQVAQMLALKNSVKVIEKRLNELQLKLASVPGLAMTESAAKPATTTAESPKVVEAVPPVSTPTPIVTPAAETPAPVAKAPVAPPKPAPVAEKASPAKPVTSDSGFFGIPFTWLAAAVALLAALLAWLVVRKKNEGTVLVGDSRISVATPTTTAPDEFNKWADEPDTQWLEQNQPGGKGAAPATPPATASSKYVPKTERTTKPAEPEADRARSAALLMGARRKDPPASATAAEAMNILMPQTAPNKDAAPKIDVNSPLDLSLSDDDIDLPIFDNGGQNIVEIPELREGQTPEDRLQRLRYMEERLPELASKTVSVDEPDTVINAARSYFEEDQQARACELLIFATEERPQEIRYWLAQFEIYRVEKLARPYSELAGKFKKLFGHTHVWNKVRHIGHELDPTNTLFAAGGEATESEQFDPNAENWLNAPNAGITNALGADLRNALFEDHEVGAKDFMSVTQRIAVIQ
jgi:pilus assembly protein FimV